MSTSGARETKRKAKKGAGGYPARFVKAEREVEARGAVFYDLGTMRAVHDFDLRHHLKAAKAPRDEAEQAASGSGVQKPETVKGIQFQHFLQRCFRTLNAGFTERF